MRRECLCFSNYKCLSCEYQEDRILAIAENRAITRKIAQCGTRAGYNRHLKQGEPTCQDCKDAQKVAVQQWKREKVSA